MTGMEYVALIRYRQREQELARDLERRRVLIERGVGQVGRRVERRRVRIATATVLRRIFDGLGRQPA